MKIKMEIFFYIFLLSVAIAVVIALPPIVSSHDVFTEPAQLATTTKPAQQGQVKVNKAIPGGAIHKLCLGRDWSFRGLTVWCEPYNSEHGMRR
jgi:hypothetical protein